MGIEYWFEKPNNYSAIIQRLGITSKDYLSLTITLKRIFPKTWIEEQYGKLPRGRAYMYLWPMTTNWLPFNPIPMFFKGVIGGSQPLVNLIRLSQMITAIEPEQGAKGLLRRLRCGPDEYIGALFELEVFERFKKSGYSLMKPIGANGPDFTFQKADTNIFVEATHRGASWVQDLVDNIANRSFELSVREEARPVSGRFIRVRLKYQRKLYNQDVVETVARRIVEVKTNPNITCFEDPQGLFSVNALESGQGGLDFEWHDPTDYIYESTELLKSKLTDEQKLRQILANAGTYVAIDMRSLMPSIAAWGGHDNYRLCSHFIASWISYIKQYLNNYRSVGGVFVWVRIVGRERDLVLDMMDQNEILFVGSPDHLTQEDIGKLFPFAKSTEDLPWFWTNSGCDEKQHNDPL